MSEIIYRSFIGKRVCKTVLVLLASLSCSCFSLLSVRANIPTNGPFAPLPNEAPVNLDEKHLFALGMIETGNNDAVIGLAGEVSRYQLSPAVWHSYSASREYRNNSVAIQVARRHWDYLAAYYRQKCGRPPTDFDMYVLWNTNYGYYAHHGFSRRLLAPVVYDRAQRFVNLVHRNS